jgi:hypothetical protein
MKKWFFAILLLAVIGLIAGACSQTRRQQQSAAWTPPPVTGTLAIGTPAPDLAPLPGTEATAAPSQEVILPTIAAPTQPPPAQAAATPSAPVEAPTRDPNLVIIAEADVLRAVTSGAAAQSGATLENVGVRFTNDNKMVLTAGRVGYGFINANNVTLVGSLVAVDGKLQLQTESITPGGLVTSLIPTIANQALQNYTSRWYIEDVRTTEGRIELRVRP